MTAVKQGDVYIVTYHVDPHRKIGTDTAVKSFYFIDRVRNEEICDAVVITFWTESLPTLHQTTGPASDILATPVMGSVEEATHKHWSQALCRVFDVIETYTHWIYKLNPQEAKE